MAIDIRKLRDEILAEKLDAEQQAADASSRAGWSRVVSGISGAVGGYRPDNSMAQAFDAQGQRAVARADRNATSKMQGAQFEQEADQASAAEARRKAEEDPNSPDALAAVQFYEGLQPGMGEKLKGMNIRRIKEFGMPAINKLMEERIAASRRAEEDERWGKRNAITSGQADHRAEIVAGRAAAAAAAKQPNVPAGEASQVGELTAAEQMVDKLWGDWQAKVSAPGSGIAAKIPGTTAAQYGDNQLAAAQSIGTILEGGKLTDADLQKYMKLMPEASDSPERAAAKKEQMRQIIQQKRAAKVQGLTQAGYKTQGFTDAASAPAGGGMVRVSNGTETLEIPEADVAEAEADGFKRVQ